MTEESMEVDRNITQGRYSSGDHTCTKQVSSNSMIFLVNYCKKKKMGRCHGQLPNKLSGKNQSLRATTNPKINYAVTSTHLFVQTSPGLLMSGVSLKDHTLYSETPQTQHINWTMISLSSNTVTSMILTLFQHIINNYRHMH